MLPDHKSIIKIFPTEFHLRFAPGTNFNDPKVKAVIKNWHDMNNQGPGPRPRDTKTHQQTIPRSTRQSVTARKNRAHNQRKRNQRAINTRQDRRPKYINGSRIPIDLGNQKELIQRQKDNLYKRYVKPLPTDKNIKSVKDPGAKIVIGKDSNGKPVYGMKTGWDWAYGTKFVNGKKVEVKLGKVQMFWYSGRWNKNQIASIHNKGKTGGLRVPPGMLPGQKPGVMYARKPGKARTGTVKVKMVKTKSGWKPAGTFASKVSTGKVTKGVTYRFYDLKNPQDKADYDKLMASRPPRPDPPRPRPTPFRTKQSKSSTMYVKRKGTVTVRDLPPPSLWDGVTREVQDGSRFDDGGIPGTRRPTFQSGGITGTRRPRFQSGGIKVTVPKTNLYKFYDDLGKTRRR